MNKSLLTSSATVTIVEKAASPVLLIASILSGRSDKYTVDIKVVNDDTLIFDYTYDD